MATQLCLTRIQNESPPLYCGQGGTADICGQIQVDINKYCQHNNVGTDNPVPQFTAGGKCWCCCSCMAWGTPVESSKGNYRLVETIEKGDQVLTTGGKMEKWSESQVTGVGGIAPGEPISFCYTVRFKLSDGVQRLMTSTADHLFLIPGGELRPIQDLRPGHKVKQADGGEATIELIVIGEFSGGVRNFTLGEFNPKANPDDPYKGHLVNTWGLVTADLAVQSAFYHREFGTRLTSEDTPPPIGSKEFFEKYGRNDYEEFLADPKQWPAHFKPLSGPVFNIPKSAALYFTESQSIALLRLGGTLDVGNSQAIANFRYLKKLFRGFYGDIYYIPDWTEDTPNAWYFNQMGQHCIVISGGLLRLPTLSIPGLSVIISHLVAQSQGIKAVGEADYHGMVVAFRDVWHEKMFFEMFEKGTQEIKATFALLDDMQDDQQVSGTSNRPTLQGRIGSIMSAGYFGGVPGSAKV